MPDFWKLFRMSAAVCTIEAIDNYGLFEHADKTVSVVIPALNEAETLSDVVGEMLRASAVAEVIVVDNGSDDSSAFVARNAGARVVSIPERGFGRALKAGFVAAQHDLVFKIDADIRNARSAWVAEHLALLRGRTAVVKAYWISHEDPMPVNNLAARPVIRKLFPALADIRIPLAGIYLADRRVLEIETMTDGWAFDLEVLFRAKRAGLNVEQIDLGEVRDRVRPISNYLRMAHDIISYVVDQSDSVSNERLLFVMAHADDVEIWCGGTLLKYLAGGARITIVILCGDETRRSEAEATWRERNRVDLVLLGDDEFVEHTRGAALRVVEILRTFRPTIAITHQPHDIHADHRRCFEVLSAAMLMAPPDANPRRVLACNGYFERALPSVSFDPDLFIDITGYTDEKYAAIGRYVSQRTTFWIEMAQRLDSANGFRSGASAAEAYQTVSFFDTPKASRWIP